MRLRPPDISLRRISAEAYDVFAMCAENVGTTNVEVQVDFKEYPEYGVSKYKERISAESDEGIFLLGPGKSVKFYVKFFPTDVARYQFYLPIILNGIIGPPQMQDVATEYPLYYLSKMEE